MTDRRVLVTGAGGQLGSALVDALLGHGGFAVTALVRRRRPRATVPCIEADLTDAPSVLSTLKSVRPDLILHAAGRVHGTPAELFRDNAAATVVLADAVLDAAPHVIVTALGSAAEYGTPPGGRALHEDTPPLPRSVYGHAKLAASRYLAASAQRGLACNLVRLFNPVGLRNSPDQVLGAAISRLLAVRREPPPRTIRMGPLDGVRDFVAIDDLAALVTRLLDERRAGIVVNACSGTGRKVRDLVYRLRSASGIDVEIDEVGGSRTNGGVPDVVIGDPARFLEMSRLSAPTPIEPLLDAAWGIAAGLPGAATAPLPR